MRTPVKLPDAVRYPGNHLSTRLLYLRKEPESDRSSHMTVQGIPYARYLSATIRSKYLAGHARPVRNKSLDARREKAEGSDPGTDRLSTAPKSDPHTRGYLLLKYGRLEHSVPSYTFWLSSGKVSAAVRGRKGIFPPRQVW